MLPSLCARLQPFLEQLSFSDVLPAQQAIGRYVLLRNARKFNSDIYNLDKDVQHLFLNEVKEILNIDYVSRCIWRAVYLAIRKNFKWQKAASNYNIDVSDILFCWDPLDAQTHKRICASARDPKNILSFLNPEQLNKLITELIPFCERVAYKKLRFIEDNDHAYTADDLTQELLIQALRVIRCYEHFSNDGRTHDLKRIKNYTKAAVTNYAVNMIGRHTNPIRARVENITCACGQCASCKAGKEHKCENVIQNFRPTTLRLDIPIAEDNSTLYDLLGVMDHDSVGERDNIDNYIKYNLSPKMVTFVDIVVHGKSSLEFDIWLRENYCTSVDQLLHNQRKLAKHVMRFLKLEEAVVQRELGPKCSDYIYKAGAKCSSCQWLSWCKIIKNVRSNSDACSGYTPVYSICKRKA